MLGDTDTPLLLSLDPTLTGPKSTFCPNQWLILKKEAIVRISMVASAVYLHKDFGTGKYLDSLFDLYQLLIQLGAVALGPQRVCPGW